MWEETELARDGDRDIHLLSNLHQVGSVQINAFQRIATVMVQKSLREGFGLTVSEALWKGRPVVGGRAGGITLQVIDGYDGYLVDDVEECAGRVIDLLADPVGADALGSQGREHVRRHFLATRELFDWLRLFGDAAVTVVVSNRGPYQFSEGPAGTVRRPAGRGGLASSLRPLFGSGVAGTDGTWVAAAISDGDRAAVRAGAVHAPGIRLTLLDLDPTVYRLAYDLVSNGTLWFLHHGLFDLPRRPGFDARWQEAWRGYETVNRAFADAASDLAADGDVVLVQDLHLALVPGMLRDRRPDLRVTHFTHTAFCGPNSIRVLPTEAARALCASMAAVPCGFHAARWARAYAASAREILGDSAWSRPRSSRHSDPTRLRSPRSSTPTRPALRSASSTRRSATGPCCCGSTASTRRRTCCAASPPTTACSRSTRRGASGSCSWLASTRHARRWPSTRPTARRWSSRRSGSTTGGRPGTGSRSCSTPATTTR